MSVPALTLTLLEGGGKNMLLVLLFVVLKEKFNQGRDPAN